MRRFFVRFNRSESFVHTQSSAGFTIITSGFEFSVHTGDWLNTGAHCSPLLTRRCVATLRDGKGQSQLAIGQGPNKKGGASHRAVAPKWRARNDSNVRPPRFVINE